jgi:hypothetical protein
MARRGQYRRGDPASGISVNSINESYYVSCDIWSFDIARTPMMVTNDFQFLNVQGNCYKANATRGLVDKKRRHMQKGRL